ncbi:hypothetical protein JZ751_003241 [Albula glossodonta]|uniref:Transmembrane protein 234 n=1 Tax=Albula glossodonta TaxID=121402 RepID=A0A8T2NGT3_9TELE|nr:hypothetical protein JZ751_005595 [Albula glossodonta]KAG9336892.1 hypothetical protein JZ751_003241 [Albula glossodonta]
MFKTELFECAVAEVLCLVVVAALWGGTNPFLRKGTEGIEEVKKSNFVMQFLGEVKFLFLNVKYMVPFLLNQSGSLVYYLTLASTDLSLAVPVANSLTFLFTLLTGKLLGEDIGGKRAVLGMCLTTLGVTLCVLSSISEDAAAATANHQSHHGAIRHVFKSLPTLCLLLHQGPVLEGRRLQCLQVLASATHYTTGFH